jgi:hypothetical protein
MLRLFLVPSGHFSFDDSGIDSVSSEWGRFLSHFPNHGVKPWVHSVSSIARMDLRKSGFDDLETAFEG